jgi:hypothetical protein
MPLFPIIFCVFPCFGQAILEKYLIGFVDLVLYFQFGVWSIATALHIAQGV